MLSIKFRIFLILLIFVGFGLIMFGINGLYNLHRVNFVGENLVGKRVRVSIEFGDTIQVWYGRISTSTNEKGNTIIDHLDYSNSYISCFKTLN